MGKLASVFSKKQTSIGSAAVILMGMVLVSGLLGLVRWRILNARFSPEETGIFLAAFRIPNLLFEILAMGALTAAFIPVFTKFLAQDQEANAHKMASTVINLTVILLLGISIPAVVFAQQLSSLLAPGFTHDQIVLMASFTRYMIFFQVVPLLVGNFFIGILQSYSLFIVPALAPVLYNIGMIVGIVAFSSTMGLYAPVIGVGIGALLFVLVQIPIIVRLGYKHSWNFNIHTPGVSQVGKLMAPRMIGLAISQIDVTVDLILSSLLGPKMVTVFYLAQSLQQLPVRLFGTTVAQAALPSLSAASAQENIDQFKNSMVESMNMILFFVLPASSLFIVLRIPIVRLLFGASHFDWEATVLTGMTLSAFSISLFAQAISTVFTRGFYALYDTKTPVIFGVITILINTTLSVFFIQFMHLPVWSLGVSTSIASIVNLFLLGVALYKRVGTFPIGKILVSPLKMFAAAILTGIVLYIPLKLFDQLVFDTTRTVGLFLLTGVSGTLGLATYFFLSWVFGVGEVHAFLALITRFRKQRTVILEPSAEVLEDKI
jgi:putative peptidoglycan lipid II flippase